MTSEENTFVTLVNHITVKPRKSSPFSGRTTKRGEGGGNAGPLRKKTFFIQKRMTTKDELGGEVRALVVFPPKFFMEFMG